MTAASRPSSDRVPVPENSAQADRPRGEARAVQTELNQARRIITRLREEMDDLKREAREGKLAKSALARLSRKLDLSARKMEYQTEAARQFQRLFVPPALPECEGVGFAVKYLMSDRVGGDLYDVFDMGNSCVGVLVADVSGEGLAATLVTAVVKMAFDTFRQNEYSPEVIMRKVNAEVLKNTLDSQFLTAFLGVLDLDTLRMKYVNASHACPILYDGDRFELLDTEGLCCGMWQEPRYEEREVQLKAGEHILFYTRGLLDTRNPRGESCKHTRLHELVRSHRELGPEAMVECVVEDFRDYLGGAEQTDDLIVVSLQVMPRKAKEGRIVIPSEPMQLSRVESRILSQLEAHNYGERAIFGVRLAVEEAVINAIKHGNKMDKAKKVTIIYSVDQEECLVTVEDEGDGFDPSKVPDPTTDENLEEPHGRGLLLMRAYTDKLTFNEKGNRLTMRKKAPWRS